MASPSAFSRVALIQVPVSPTSAGDAIPFPEDLKGRSNLFFYFDNLTPYDIRLEGTTAAAYAKNGDKPNAVTATSGWPVPARQQRGIFVSKMPIFLSAMIVSTSGNPLVAGTDYTGVVLDMIYLTRG